jgi:hypothetical protein
MTTNVEDLQYLPAALRDRFPVAIHIDRPHPSALLSLSEDLREPAMVSALAEESRRVSLRQFYVFDALRHSLGADRAATLVFGGERREAVIDALTIGSLA